MQMPLHGPDFMLREFETADIPAFVHIASKSEFNFYAFPLPTAPREEIEAGIGQFVQKCINLQQKDPNTGIRENYKLVVAELTKPENVIGYVALDEVSESRGEMRDIGYITDPKYQGKGYATSACALMLREFFDETAYNSIMATAHPENIPSIRVLEKLGYKQVGTSSKVVRGIVEPRYVYTLSREDFFASLQPKRNPLAVEGLLMQNGRKNGAHLV